MLNYFTAQHRLEKLQRKEGTGMNIFENLYAACNKDTEKPFEEKFPAFITGVRPYCQKPARNPREEFLTQVFRHIMLEDPPFRKAFLQKLNIEESNWHFDAEHGEKGENGEMDIFGTSSEALLIIENKLGSEIGLAQAQKYAQICRNHTEKKKYIVVLTKFSGMIPYWNSYKSGIQKQITDALQKDIESIVPQTYTCRHIYWHEVYTLLKENFSDKNLLPQLLDYLKMDHLDQYWLQDMGCPFWRQAFIQEFNNFAQKNNLPQKRIPEPLKKGEKPNIAVIRLKGENNCFGGARIQGARRAEACGNHSLLQINVNGKSIDLSECINDPALCISKSAELIKEAYSKK